MTQLTKRTNQRLRTSKHYHWMQWLRLKNLGQNRFRLNVILASVTLLLGVTYLGMVNRTASTTFYLSTLRGQHKLAQTAQADLALQASEVLSLQHINTAQSQYNLVAATAVDYLSSTSAVALSH